MEDREMKDWLRERANVVRFLPENVVPRELLFTGGQGVVYRGTVDGQETAIKLYLPGQLHTRVDREVDALRELQCPAVVQLLWADRVIVHDHELSVVATAFVEGVPLNDLLTKGPLDETHVAVLVFDAALAIEAMWEHRIVHRDLKPSNVVIRPTGHACVIDLGIARHLDETSLTQVGFTWGTVGYMSPEQWRCERQLTCKSDIYALAVVAVESGIGRHPTLRNQQRLVAADLHQELPSPLSSWAWASLLHAMLHPRPTKRPLPRDVVAALSSLVKESRG